MATIVDGQGSLRASMMSVMKLCTYLFGYLAATHLTDAVVRKEEKEIIGFMSPIKQINNNFIAEQTAAPTDQLYGPILPDGSCPTIHGIKQLPSHVANYSVCGPACQGQEACPAAPASGQPYCLGTPNGTKETYSCHVDCFNKGDADCQKGAVCVCTWFRLCVCFYDNGE